MSIYRRTSSNGKRSRFLTAEFSYQGKKHIRSGFVDRDSAKFWLNSEMLRMRRGAVGYVKPMLASQVSPLIEAFADRLRTRGRDDMYAYIAEKRLTRLARDCAWVTLGDVTSASLREWLDAPQNADAGRNRGKPIGNRTKNQYLDTAIEFGKWLAKPAQAKLASNPFADVERLTAKSNDDYRRSGTVDELNKLLATCPTDRRLYYLFRIYHAKIRSGVLPHLTWRMMDLDARHPFAKTPAEINKSRKPEKHPIRFEIAQELRKSKRDGKAKADDLVFPNPPTLDDLKSDLAKAGVTFADERGHSRLDYHALRATLVQICKNAGLTAFQTMDMLGHRDIRTTLKYYNKLTIEPEKSEAMEKLPTLGTMRRAQ